MVDSTITKPLGLVLIVTAHMVFNGPSRAEITETTETTGITRITGSDATLEFRFDNAVIHQNDHFAVYTSNEKKIDEFNNCSGRDVFKVYPKNTSVLYHIINITQNHSGIYWVALFGVTGVHQSNKVNLYVKEADRSSTVPPVSTTIAVTEESGSSSLLVIILLMVSPIVLLTAVLPCVIWCLMRTKDKQPQPQQNSNPQLQETIASIRLPPPSVIYSVLDFPKRPSAVLEINPNDTEYAAVGYLSENRHM